MGVHNSVSYMDPMVRKHGMARDLYCLIMTDTGGRRTGADYYQNMIIWSVPAALSGTDFSDPCQAGGLVYRIKNAGLAHQSKKPKRIVYHAKLQADFLFPDCHAKHTVLCVSGTVSNHNLKSRSIRP